MGRIFFAILFLSLVGFSSTVFADGEIMTDSGEIKEVSADGEYMTDSGEVKDVSDDGEYMTDSGSVREEMGGGEDKKSGCAH